MEWLIIAMLICSSLFGFIIVVKISSELVSMCLDYKKYIKKGDLVLCRLLERLDQIIIKIERR